MVTKKDLQTPLADANAEAPIAAIVGERLTLAAFNQISGNLAGYPFVKIVIDRPARTIHFLNNAAFRFHGDYIAQQVLGIGLGEFEAKLDSYNASFYTDPNRKYYLAI